MNKSSTVVLKDTVNGISTAPTKDAILSIVKKGGNEGRAYWYQYGNNYERIFLAWANVSQEELASLKENVDARKTD